MSADLIVGDLGVVYSATLRNADDNTVIDLTGKTVTLCFRINDGPTVRRTMLVESPAVAGNVSYAFSPGDLNEPGIMMVEIEISGSASSVTITAGVNDKIDYSNIFLGAGAVTVAGGVYTTSTTILAAINAALNGAGLISFFYYDIALQKFITETDHYTQYMFLTGVNFATSIHRTLGFPDANIPADTFALAATSVPFTSVVLTSRDPKQYVVRTRV